MKRVELAVIGAGHAGIELATVLRRKGFDGSIRLFSDENALPYDRPPLSKNLLAGKVSVDRIALRAQSFFDKHDIALSIAGAVAELDVTQGTLGSADGENYAFDRCVLATGAGVRRLSIPGVELPGVFVLRNLRDAIALREVLVQGVRLVVVGGGYLGLEAASTARALGASVTVLESASTLMSGKVSVPVAAAYATLHQQVGTRLCLASGASRVYGNARVEGVQTTDGELLPADVVLIAVGAVPNTALANQSGLACDNGILVDRHLCAVPERVYAIGDCARPEVADGVRLQRMESVHNAISQARKLAAYLLGMPPPATRVPYFWSEQEGVKLQVAGQVAADEPCEERCVGDEPTAFSVYRFQDGQLACVEAVGDPTAFVRGQRLVGRAGIADIPIPD